MTDQDESEQPPDLRELLESVERHHGPDFALQSLVDMINGFGDSLAIGLTLLVHGHIVTGEAVSGRQFFEGLAQGVKVPVSGDNEATEIIRAGLAERFEAHRDTYPTFPPDDADAVPLPPSLKGTTYLHLKNAYVVAGGERVTIPTDDGLWLRIRLAAVDGFTMGSMRVS